MLKAKDQGHRRKCSPKNKKVCEIFSGDLKKNLQTNFRANSKTNVFKNIFQPIYKILTTQKIVLSSSRGQGNFRGLEASMPRT